MAVLKSKQTRVLRVVYGDNQHIRIVHPYTLAFLGSASDSVILLYTSIHQYS